jgi:hypothetical protein
LDQLQSEGPKTMKMRNERHQGQGKKEVLMELTRSGTYVPPPKQWKTLVSGYHALGMSETPPTPPMLTDKDRGS